MNRLFAAGWRSVCILGLLSWAATAAGANPEGASSNRAAREEAVRQIPFDRMNEAVQQKITDVVTRPTMFRRMPTQTIECDPEMFLCLVRNPELVVNMWHLMGATQVSVQRTGPFTATASDGAGTSSNAELLYGTPKVHVVFADARYEGPLTKRTLTGKAVLVLHSNYTRTQHDTVQVSSRLDVFVSIDQTAADLVVKTLQGLFGSAADSNFTETIKFIGQVNRSAETNGDAVQQRLVPQLTRVQPAVRDEFARVSLGTQQRAAQRMAARVNVPMQVSSVKP